MASTYTDILRLTLPTTGELDATWGDVVNTGITALIETSIAGTAAVTHNDTANYTLTTASGAADQARAMFLNVGGALTADRNVVCPTKSKLYFVRNATTGSHAITLKTSGGTGISVPSGKYMMLYCDGTNVVEAINWTNANAATATSAATAATATSANTLTTPRAIYGNNFDGSAALTQVIAGTYGGTGVNNSTRTITYAGNVEFTGAFNVSLTVPGAYTYTLPSATTTLAGLGVANTFTTGQLVQPATDVSPLTLRGHASATANLIQLQSSGSSPLFYVTGTGAAQAAGGVDKLTTASGVVSVAAATAPNAGDVLTASSATVAAWTAPAVWVSLSGNNTWTGTQTFTNSLMKLLGSSTGATTFTSANAGASDYTITFPASTGTVLTTATVVTAAQGGTGVANGANNTIAFTGNYTFGATLSNNTAVTFPTSGTLAVLGANTFTGAQTLGNNNLLTIKTASFNGQGTQTSTTGSLTIDWTTAQNYLQTEPTGTITYTFTAPPGPCHLQLIINSDGTSTAQTINWPGTVIRYGGPWAGVNNKKSIINFWYDGTSYHMTGMNEV